MEINEQCPDIIFKVALIGDSHAGKTSIVNKYVNNSMNNTFISTIGVDFLIKTIHLKDKTIKIQIWDTAGQEKYASLIRSYFSNCTCALIVYDITDRQSFSKIDKWLKSFNDNFNEKRPCVLVGNKIDLERKREVSTEEAILKANELDLGFIECSAKTGENIDILFNELSYVILDKIENNKIEPNNLNGLKLKNKMEYMYIDEKKKDDKCCIIL